MVDQKVLWNGTGTVSGPVQDLAGKHLIETVLKILQEQFAAFTGEKTENVVVIFLEMLEKMTENRRIPTCQIPVGNRPILCIGPRPSHLFVPSSTP